MDWEYVTRGVCLYIGTTIWQHLSLQPHGTTQSLHISAAMCHLHNSLC